MPRTADAFGGLKLVEANFQEGGFSDAVFADDASAGAGADGEVEIAEKPAREFFGAEVDPGFLQLDDDVSEICGGREEKIHLTLFGWGVLVFDFMKGVEAGALFGAACLDAGAHPFELGFEKLLALCLGLLGDLLADGFGFKEGGVVTGV